MRTGVILYLKRPSISSSWIYVQAMSAFGTFKMCFTIFLIQLCSINIMNRTLHALYEFHLLVLTIFLTSTRFKRLRNIMKCQDNILPCRPSDTVHLRDMKSINWLTVYINQLRTHIALCNFWQLIVIYL